jgi:hypothetical protein
MMPGYDDRQIKARLLVWWVIWSSALGFLLLIYVIFAKGKNLPVTVVPSELPRNLSGVIPLFISIVLRWLVLPRYTSEGRALVLSVIGIALAEACGILGLILGGPYRDSLWVLGVLGVAQYVPFYAKKLFDPKGSGFIPNN